MNNVHDVDPLWTVEDVSAYLGVPVGTLYQWRSKGYGPAGRRMGRYVRYRPEDVRAWVDQLAVEVA
ncbi:helix-turn-helix transcriptional regulator [Amycolatopsis keratiniphila]|uniref:Excisionase n=1 Tax=Amycolatopsis keratiniphila subsp. keratiniphila TaxID=227715 RepID=A0A1W2LRM0_9PSEU|nr:helix-turn-helix domain-containing protein [Amycolatopsis keratiniphila]ONF66953.1 excisionase [Amycolatopsis keratiniphila subsp. keratiniphila]